MTAAEVSIALSYRVTNIAAPGNGIGALMDDYAWYKGNSKSGSHPAGTKTPNELGLYDMSGNVAEWCWDWYDPFIPGGKITSGSPAGKGPSAGPIRD